MWAQWAQTRTRCADGPVKARNGPAGMKWEGRTLGKTASEAGLKPGYCRETPPVTTRKTLAVLVQTFPRPAPQRRLLHQGLPGRDYRGLPGRPCVSVCLPGRSSPEHPLRQYQAGGGEDTGGRPASAHPGLHRAAVPPPVRGPVRASRQGQ